MTAIVGDWPGGTDQRHKLIIPVGSVSGLVQRGWLSLATGWGASARGDVQFIASGHASAPHPAALTSDVRSFWEIPDGTDQINITITSDGPVAWALELDPYGNDEE